MSLDDLAITMGKLGEGEWELQLDDGTSIDVTLDRRGGLGHGRETARRRQTGLIGASTRIPEATFVT